jgi:Lar family restriction alleviation protein
MSMEKLKKCPFCGNKGPMIVVDDETENFFGVCCFKCEANVNAVFETMQDAVKAWNRRCE